MAGVQVFAHDLLKQREYKFGFVGNRVFALVHIAALHVQRVDAHSRGRGYVDHRTAKRAHHRRKLALRVKNKYIIIGRQQYLHDLLLGAHGLACAGYAKADAVAVGQQCAVGNDHIAGDSVAAVADTAGLLYLLHRKGGEDGRALGKQGALLHHTAQSVGQHRVKADILLKFQDGQIAAKAARGGLQRFGIGV